MNNYFFKAECYVTYCINWFKKRGLDWNKILEKSEKLKISPAEYVTKNYPEIAENGLFKDMKTFEEEYFNNKIYMKKLLSAEKFNQYLKYMV